MQRRLFTSLLPALLATLARPVMAQGAFPNKPMRIIVPFTPGGGNDVYIAPTYGNTLMGLAAAEMPKPPDYKIAYYAPEPRAVVEVVDFDDYEKTVDFGKEGRVMLTTLTRAMAQCDVLVPAVTDQIDAGLIDAAPERKIEVLRRATDEGAPVEDLDVVPPTLDQLYAHFLLSQETAR